MGMMNNCCYRVKIHPRQGQGERGLCCRSPVVCHRAAACAMRRRGVGSAVPLLSPARRPVHAADGQFGLQFEHPTIAGPTVGGWMNRAEDAAAAAAAAVSAPRPPAGAPALAAASLRGTTLACVGPLLPACADASFVQEPTHRPASKPIDPMQLPPPLFLLQLAAAPPPPPAAVAGAAGPRLITMAEVEKHTTKESAWFVSDGKVYDATPFLKEHPGEAPAQQGRGDRPYEQGMGGWCGSALDWVPSLLTPAWNQGFSNAQRRAGWRRARRRLCPAASAGPPPT